MRALALVSGGLDSVLAARLIMEQGIEVVGVGFRTPFFTCRKGRKAAGRIGIQFHCYDVTTPFLRILENPAYGYGKNLNPCIDCHRLMVKEAFARMASSGASFVVSGEVLGQRPKSQTRVALQAVAQAAEKGLLLRPLSARLMEETLPEKEGWVDRHKLLNISGRSRRRQLELAERYGMTEYSTPAGGCLLTEPEFCRKLWELKDREGWGVEHLRLLNLGRNFRISSGAKVVSGRNQEENSALEEAARPGDYFFQAVARPASLVLLRRRGELSREDITEAAAICARYSKEKPPLRIGCWKKARPEDKRIINARPFTQEKLAKMRI